MHGFVIWVSSSVPQPKGPVGPDPHTAVHMVSAPAPFANEKTEVQGGSATYPGSWPERQRQGWEQSLMFLASAHTASYALPRHHSRGSEEKELGWRLGTQLQELSLAFLILYIRLLIFLTLFPYLIWSPFQLSSLCAAASLLPGLIALI